MAWFRQLTTQVIALPCESHEEHKDEAFLLSVHSCIHGQVFDTVPHPPWQAVLVPPQDVVV
jgi:hypothetical protein